ncbi:MAG: SDR family oxidoreductase [Nocardioides sp.]|uniref:SDR family NAD(P)-dependent oxidoreductase n=1 Tax=Nocardioides sp. TaxID=35761 RepID=UPI0039E3BEB0
MPTALITGATAGIGLAFAQQLAVRGHDLVLVARDEARLATTADELATAYGVGVEVLAADLTDREQLKRVEERVAGGARLDLLVNNAGFGLKKRFAENTADEETAMLEVLVTAVLRLSHAALSARTDVINVSSVAGFLPRGTYGAAKAWVNSFSEWAHAEYAPQGVRVMALCPGFTATEFHERMGVDPETSAPRFMWLDVDDLVATALADFEKGRAISIPSVRYKAIASAGRHVPHRLLQRFQSLGRK